MVFDQFPALAGREIGRRYPMQDHLTVRIGDDYGVLMPIIPDQDHLYARVGDLLGPAAPDVDFSVLRTDFHGRTARRLPVSLHVGEVAIRIHGGVRAAP